MLILAIEVPWWGSGLFTLAGAVLTALLVQVFSMLNSRSKSKGEQGERDQRQRKQALTDLLEAGHAGIRREASGVERAASLYAALMQTQLVLDGDVERKALDFYYAATELSNDHKELDEARERTKVMIRAENELIISARKAHMSFGLPALTSEQLKQIEDDLSARPSAP